MTRKDSRSDLAGSKALPTSQEVSAAAFDVDRTIQLVTDYRLSAVELAQLLDRLEVKPVPW